MKLSVTLHLLLGALTTLSISSCPTCLGRLALKKDQPPFFAQEVLNSKNKIIIYQEDGKPVTQPSTSQQK